MAEPEMAKEKPMTRALSIPPREAMRYVVTCGHEGCRWRAETDFVSRAKALDLYVEHEEEDHGVTD
jgi:hypothetical protein